MGYMKNFFLNSRTLLAFGLCAYCASAFSWDECTPPPEHISVSHTEGRGLGYSIGYSSLDLFLSQPFSDKTFVPFLDLRGHIFNNGKYAANAGLGFRYISDCFAQVWGINAFYDYLQTQRRIYNQVGMGLEVLGKHWDVRVNGYLPVGHKKTNIYRFSYDFFDRGTPGFLLRAREQLALKGVDSLIGYRYCKARCFDLTIGAGPYFYWGRSEKTVNVFRAKNKHAFGGQLRAGVSFMDYLFLDGIGTYDSLFKWNGQATFTLSLPFDFTFKQNSCCERSYCLQERAYRPVVRNEIIVVDPLHRFSTNPLIFDPEFQP